MKYFYQGTNIQNMFFSPDLKIRIKKYRQFQNMTLKSILIMTVLAYFQSIFDEFLLFLMVSKWRENPQSDRPQIFAALKLQKQFWKVL